MRRCLYWFSLAVAMLLATQVVRADETVTFTVLPPDVSGPAGTTVGWGYSITNNSTTDYLDISGIDASVFQDGTPDSSPFVFSFSPLAPGATEMQDYDPVDDLGLFQLTWDADAPVGFTDSGSFGLSGAFCDLSLDDTTCAEDFTVLSTDLVFANYSATVISSSTNSVREPSALVLLLSGLCGLGLWTWHRQRNSAWPTTHGKDASGAPVPTENSIRA